MRIKTNANELSLTVVALDGIQPDEMKPATVYGKDDEPQLVDGRKVYRLGSVYVKDGEGRKLNASVRVFAKPAKPVDELTKVRLTGAVWITPYVQSGSNRIGFSIVAEGVEAAA